MTTVADLLPANRSRFENAVAAAINDTLPVPLRQILDAAQTPEAFLPFLAAHESVDLWFEDWALPRKRAMVGEAMVLAALKGTRQGSIRYLAYVDGALLDVIAYPAPFIFDEAILDVTPIDLPSFVAQYLVKVVIDADPDSFVFDDAVLGEAILINPDTTKLERCLIALRVAKAPETEIRVDFQHMRPLSTLDAPLIGGAGTHYVGEYVDRKALEGTP